MVASHLKVIEAYGAQWHHCPSCQRYLQRDDFAKNKNRPFGLHAYCLECNRRKQAAERARRGEDYREMRRRYRASPKGQAAYARYVPAHPWQVWAQSKVWNAIERGLLVKPDTCEQCGKFCKTDGHHDDYAKPLAVRWLCRWCHQEWHRINGEAANAGMHVVTAGKRLEQQNRIAARLPEVAKMRAAGMQQKNIAAHFCVTQATICNDFKRLDGRL